MGAADAFLGEISDGMLHVRLERCELDRRYSPVRDPSKSRARHPAGASLVGEDGVDTESEHPVDVVLVHSSSASLCLVLPRLTICSRKSFSARCCMRPSRSPPRRGDRRNRFFCPMCARAPSPACPPAGSSRCRTDARVRGLKVHAETARARGEQEGEHGRVWPAEPRCRWIVARDSTLSNRAYWYPSRSGNPARCPACW